MLLDTEGSFFFSVSHSLDNKEKSIEHGIELLLNNSDRSILFLCENSNEKSLWMKCIHDQLQEIAEKERSFELQYKQSQLPVFFPLHETQS